MVVAGEGPTTYLLAGADPFDVLLGVPHSKVPDTIQTDPYLSALLRCTGTHAWLACRPQGRIQRYIWPAYPKVSGMWANH